MKTQSSNRILAALLGAVAILSLPVVSRAVTNSVWNIDSGGNWSTSGNWTAGVPASPGDTASLTFNITAARAVTNDVSRSIGVLNIGDSTTSFFAYTLANSGGATLTFNNNGNGASLVEAVTTAGDTISTPIILADNLNITNSSSLKLNGVVSGGSSFGLLKAGAGTMVFGNGNINTYSGVTTIAAGTLQLGQSGAFGNLGSGSTSVVINSGATLSIYQGETVNQVISGAGNVSSPGAVSGNTTLSAANSYTGTTTVNGGGYVINAPILANSGVNSSIGASGNAASNLILTGSGTLAYTGASPVNTDRLLQIGVNSAGGSGTLANNAASAVNSLSFTNPGAIAYGTAGQTRTVILGGSNLGANNFAPLIGDNGAGVVSLSKSGASTWTVSGANTFTGPTVISAGTLNVTTINSVTTPAPAANSSLGNPSSTANGTISLGSTTSTGTLVDLGTGETSDRVINLAGTSGNGTLDQSGTGLWKLTKDFTATGIGSKTLTLQGSTAGSGEIGGKIVDNGTAGTTVTTVAITSGVNTITLASVDGILAGAAISGTNIPALTTVTAVNPATKLVTMSANTANTGPLGQTITVAGVSNITYVAKAGTNTWTLSGLNTYSGATTVGAGTLALSGSGAIVGSPISITPGALFDVSGLSGTFTLGSGQTLNGGRASNPATDVKGDVISGGTINPGGASTAGTLTINGNLSLTGGTLNYDLGSGASDLITLAGAGRTLTLSGTTTVAVGPVPAGTYTLISGIAGGTTGSGLTASFTSTGARGTLGATFSTTTPNVKMTVTDTVAPKALIWQGSVSGNWNFADLNWNGGADQFYNLDAVIFANSPATTNLVIPAPVYPGSVTFSNTTTSAYIFSGAGGIAGSAGVTKTTGNGTVYLNGANSYYGGTTIGAGTISLGNGTAGTENANALGSGTVTVKTGGTLQFKNAGGTTVFNIPNAVTLDGGTILSVDNYEHLTGPVNVTANGGTLSQYWDTKSLWVDGVLSGSGPLTVNNGNTATSGVHFSNPLNTYSGTITVTGNGVTVDSPNALANATVSVTGGGSSGPLQWGAGVTGIVLGNLSGSVNIANGGNALSVGNNSSFFTTTTYSGILSGAGSLTKLGAGTFIMSATNTYSGATTVSAGTLAIAGRLTGGGAVTVNDGATLNVAAKGATSVITNAASLTLGVSGITTLSISNFAGSATAPVYVNSLAANGTVYVALSGALSAGVQYPLIKYSGSIGGAGFNAFQLARGLVGRLTNNIANSSVDVVLSSSTVFPLAWTGVVDTNWDVNTSSNWAFNGVGNVYLNNDNVQFDDTAVSGNTNVALNIPVTPASVTVTNNALSYTISGSGALAGNTGLTKNGPGSLTLLTTNTYLGVTTINGGTVSIPTIASNGLACAIGTGSGSSANLVLNGGTLAYTGPTNATDRALSIGANGGGVSVTSNLTLNAAISGAGGFAKSGPGTLTVAVDPPVTGGIAINAGTLRITPGNFAGAFTPSLITVNTNGTLLGNSTHSTGGNTSIFINRGTWLMNGEDYKQNLAMVDGLIAPGPNPVSGGGDLRVGYAGGGGSYTWYVSNSIAGSVINSKVNTVTSSINLTMNVARGLAPSDLTINGVIYNSGSIAFVGGGITTLTGTNTYSGNTTVNGGTVFLTNSAFSPSTPVVTLLNNATFDITGLASPFVLSGIQTLQGSGMVVGNVADSGGSTFTPGGVTNVGTLAVNGDLTFAGSESLNFDLGRTPTSAGGTNSDQITVAGNLTINPGTTVNVNPIQLALAGGRYKLITYVGVLTNAGSTASWTLNDPGVVAGRVTGASIDESIPGEIDLLVTGTPATLVWQGDGAANAWDVGTANWLNGASPDLFYQFDNVVFNDTSANTNVDVQYPVTPSSIVVSNNAVNYAFNSTVGQNISGGTTLTKNGAGSLTILNSNPYTGLTTINSGALVLGDGASYDGALPGSPIVNNGTLEFNVASSQTAATAISGSGAVVLAGNPGGTLTLGAVNSWTGGLNILSGTALPGVNNALPARALVSVAAGAAYDFNGKNNGSTTNRSYTFSIAGAGPSGAGALLNSGASIVQYASVSNLTLSADATVGGSGRWDIGPVPNSIVYGNGHVLTKAGLNDLDLRAQIVTNLAGIHITSGNLYYENYSQTNPWTANSTNILESGAKLGIYGSQTINVPIVANGGTIDNQGSGTPVWTGPLDLEGATTLSSAAGSLVYSGNISAGPGGTLTLIGGSTLTLSGSNSYAAATAVTAGASVLVQNNQGAANGGWVIGPDSSATTTVSFDPSSTIAVAGASQIQIGNTSATGTSVQTLYAAGAVNNSGTLAVGRDAVLSLTNGANWSQVGDMALNGYGGYSAAMNVNSNASITYSGVNSIKLNGAASNSGQANLTIDNTGLFTTGAGFEDVNTPTTGYGRVTLSNGGTIRLSADVAGLTTQVQFVLGAGGGVIDNNGHSTALSGNVTVGATANGISGAGSLTKKGNGTLTLAATNSYTGNTVITAGTLALGATAAIATSTSLIIAGGAGLDVSANPFVLGGAQVLTNSGSTAVLNGNINASAGKVSLTYASGTPSFNVTNGTLTLAPTSTVKVYNTGAALAAGSYKLISKAVTGNVGSVAGTLPSSAVVVGGNGVAVGATNALQITSGELFLVVTQPVTVNTNSAPIVSTTSGSTLTLTWPTDHQGWRLQVQTNNLTTGISTNWYDWPGSTNTTSVSISMDPNAPTVFFRMIYP